MTLCLCGQSSSRNQSQLFSHLYRLRSTPRTQLVEQAAGMGLDGVFADKEFFSDLTIAQAVGNPLRVMREPVGSLRYFSFRGFWIDRRSIAYSSSEVVGSMMVLT